MSCETCRSDTVLRTCMAPAGEAWSATGCPLYRLQAGMCSAWSVVERNSKDLLGIQIGRKLGNRIMAAYTDLVAVHVTKIRSIVVGMIVRPQSRSPLVRRSVLKCPSMNLIHGTPVKCEQRDHLSVSWTGSLTVKRTADEEQRPRDTFLHPASPGLFRFRELQDKTEFLHDARVEGKGAAEVRNPDVNMRQHHVPAPCHVTTIGTYNGT